MKPISIKFFKAYSDKAEKLKQLLEDKLVDYLCSQLGVESTLTICDSHGFPNSSLQVITAAFNNEIVIIDGSIEEVKGYELGVNYECITPAVSSLDNIIIVSRTQLPLNLIPCRSNVAPLGEKDTLNPDNNKGGYSKEYDNNQIIDWLFKEFKSMRDNIGGNRLNRQDDLLIDLNRPINEWMKQEMEVMNENMGAIAKEKAEFTPNGSPKKKIFISYRTRYYPKDGRQAKYKGIFDINDVADAIMKYHANKGDVDEWEYPFFYPHGVLSNEFMPEYRRWAFVSIPDRKIRECDEFWIFDTRYQPEDENGNNGEVGYWDSWWCLGEFLTIVRMKHDSQLVKDEHNQYHKRKWDPITQTVNSIDKGSKDNIFRVMVFCPDMKNPIQELSIDKIPPITEAQNRELSRYFANGDFLESGLESMEDMRKKRKWPKLLRYPYFLLMRKFVWPKIAGDDTFKDYPFEHFEESIWSHVYDTTFVDNRILTCLKCTPKGKKLKDILTDKYLIWNFLNINNHYTEKGAKKQEGVIQMNDHELKAHQVSEGLYKFSCDHQHDIIIKKSPDKFFIYWAPRRGKKTGPNNSMIETVDLYELA